MRVYYARVLLARRRLLRGISSAGSVGPPAVSAFEVVACCFSPVGAGSAADPSIGAGFAATGALLRRCCSSPACGLRVLCSDHFGLWVSVRRAADDRGADSVRTLCDAGHKKRLQAKSGCFLKIAATDFC